MDYTVHGILQARILEWVAVYSFRGSSQPGIEPSFPASQAWFFTIWATRYDRMFSSVAQLCPTLCNPTDCSTPGFPVHHQHLKLAQTHVCRVGDAIQPPQPLSSPPPSALNLSQHQGLFFKWISSSHQVAKSIGVSASASVLPVNIRDWFSLGWSGWISLQAKGLSKVFSNTTVQKHQFFSAQLSL